MQDFIATLFPKKELSFDNKVNVYIKKVKIPIDIN